MNVNLLYSNVYKGKKVLITGHTGFKGSWLCILLNKLGAEIYGYALEPPTNPNLYTEAKLDDFVNSTIGDIRDYSNLLKVVRNIKPQIVIHMAAQPLVRESYKRPVETYEINVMGTVNLLEACRNTSSVKAIVNVTTDKCYENQEWHWGYRENEPMGGYDPYSNSKGCSELVTSCYRNSYFHRTNYSEHGVAIASARAGNVIGGGDWAIDRLIPDLIKSLEENKDVIIRNPSAIRPWQHVLEPLNGYLQLASKLYIEGSNFSESWNFGPNEEDIKDVEWITKTFCEQWGNNGNYKIDKNQHPHEASLLKLDCSKAKSLLGWYPKWNILTTIKSIVDWYKSFESGENAKVLTERQIELFYNK